jgi:hypothetical protein
LTLKNSTGSSVTGDAIGRDYVVLSLRLGDVVDGFVDSYFGPAELRDEAAATKRTPQELVADAAGLRERVARDEPDAQRSLWLDRQLLGIETTARKQAGEEIDYVEEVERSFDARPEATPPERFSEVRRRLDDLLPAGGSLHERLEARDDRLTIPNDKLEGIIEWVVGEIRATCAAQLPIPDGESLSVSLVTNEPWGAYNWYDGDLRSRIEFNVDLPTRAQSLVPILGHETFPGHHLEHAWKEQRLVREQGRLECSIQLINTPEAYISEGLAEVGPALFIRPERWRELLLEICRRAGIDMTAEDAQREWDITQATRLLRGSSGDAALMLNAEGRSADEVRQFLIDEALRTPEQAIKHMQFLTHPLWRTYTFCYAGGQALLTQWCLAAGDEKGQRDRFFRLLSEQLTPSGIAKELASA